MKTMYDELLTKIDYVIRTSSVDLSNTDTEWRLAVIRIRDTFIPMDTMTPYLKDSILTEEDAGKYNRTTREFLAPSFIYGKLYSGELFMDSESSTLLARRIESLLTKDPQCYVYLHAVLTVISLPQLKGK